MLKSHKSQMFRPNSWGMRLRGMEMPSVRRDLPDFRWPSRSEMMRLAASMPDIRWPEIDARWPQPADWRLPTPAFLNDMSLPFQMPWARPQRDAWHLGVDI